MLDAVDRSIPPAFLGGGSQMRYVVEVVDGIEQHPSQLDDIATDS